MNPNEDNILNQLMRLINKAGTVILANLLFLVSCVPVVTIGAAWSGLYGAMRFQIRGDSWFDGFKEGFKSHFIRNTVVWSVCAAAGYLALDNVLYYAGYLAQGYTEYMTAAIIQTAGSGLFLLAVLLFITVAIPVGLYIPTDVNTWLKYTWDLIFHAPLQVLGTVALMWLPVALALFFTDFMISFLLVFVAAYFVLAMLVMTILLKNPLIRILYKHRAQTGENG